MKDLNTYILPYRILFFITIFVLCVNTSYSQPSLPQRSITVTPVQAICFGTLAVNASSGTVSVDYSGSRFSSGGVTLLNMSPSAQPAIFEIKLCQGRNVIITYSATITLYGSNGGTLTMDIGPTEKGGYGSIFPTLSDCNFITPLRVGGTLHIPANAVPGNYTGSFTITFNQE